VRRRCGTVFPTSPDRATAADHGGRPKVSSCKGHFVFLPTGHLPQPTLFWPGGPPGHAPIPCSLAAETLAIAVAFITTLASVVLYRILLLNLGGGVVPLINAFLARSWKGFVLHFFAGLLYLVVGGLMVEPWKRPKG
jgi:hypothetical protein